MDAIPVSGVSELVLEVVDLEAAERFYADVLGFPVVDRWPDRGAVWVMAGDRTRIGLWRPQVGLHGGRGGLHVHFAMKIADEAFDATVALLRERGQEVKTAVFGTTHGRAAYVDDPDANVVVAGREGVHVTPGESTRLALVPLAEAGDGEPLLLGLDDRGPVFAAEGDRSRQSLLGLREAGHLRHCPRCGAEHHPRTDPVVIMLVLRGDDVLLGRQPSWPPGRYSALAGFVEPGESLEEAVAREVREEAQVEIGPPRYVSSQPWTFPASLMLGFVAPWASGEPRVGDEELEDARWFTRAELRDAVAQRGPLRLPPPLAIARRLLDGWLESAWQRP